MHTRIDNPRNHKIVRIRFYCPGNGRAGSRPGYSPCDKVNTILADNIKGIASQPIRGGRPSRCT